MILFAPCLRRKAHIGLLCCAFRHCATHKNNLIRINFLCDRTRREFVHSCLRRKAHIGLLCCAFRHCATHKNNLIRINFLCDRKRREFIHSCLRRKSSRMPTVLRFSSRCIPQNGVIVCCRPFRFSIFATCVHFWKFRNYCYICPQMHT